MARKKLEDVEFEVISEAEAEEVLAEQYADPRRAKEFFDGVLSQRQQAISAFLEQANEDPEVSDALLQNPLQAFRERGLLGPGDLLQVDLHERLFPWPLPWCRLECRWIPVVIVEWICVKIFGFRFCWPRIRVILRLRCRLVCG